VIPFFNAKPLRGRIWASKPAGISTNKPVGISFLSNGFNTTGPGKKALKSIPADNSVLQAGNSLFDLFTILISI
jgi:hypothetical protein